MKSPFAGTLCKAPKREAKAKREKLKKEKKKATMNITASEIEIKSCSTATGLLGKEDFFPIYSP